MGFSSYLELDGSVIYRGINTDWIFFPFLR